MICDVTMSSRPLARPGQAGSAQPNLLPTILLVAQKRGSLEAAHFRFLPSVCPVRLWHAAFIVTITVALHFMSLCEWAGGKPKCPSPREGQSRLSPAGDQPRRSPL